MESHHGFQSMTENVGITIRGNDCDLLLLRNDCSKHGTELTYSFVGIGRGSFLGWNQYSWRPIKLIQSRLFSQNA